MKVLILGLPYFAKKLKEDLSGFDKSNRYIFLDTYYSFIDKIIFIFILPFVDVVISLNGVSDKSGTLELAVKLKKKIIMHWQGTDVLLALKRFHNNTIYKKYIENSFHFTDSENLKNELNSISINCSLLYYKFLNISEYKSDSKSKTAYTYIAKNKENFYGWEIIKDAFEQLPDYKLIVVGTDGENLNAPKNVTFKGWVSKDEMKKIIKENILFIRLTEHDGFSLSVLEALSAGNYIIWNYKIENGFLLENKNELKSLIVNSFNNNIVNYKGIEWIKNNFNKELILSNLLNKINEIGSK